MSRDQHRDVSRVEAFSDGVFAFAVTLLVITIRIPRPADPDASAGLQQLVLEQWPAYVAFAITFAVVGIIWANHRLMFSHIARTDHTLVSLNLLELMGVAFLPVPTGILGTWTVSDRNRLFAVVFYSGTLVALGFIHNLMWWYAAYWSRLTSSDLSAAKRLALSLTWIPGPILYAVCLGLAWIDPRISLLGFGLLAIVYLLPTPHLLMQAQRIRNSRREAPGQ